MKKSFYDMLQVSPDADMDIIEAAYQSKMKKFEARFDLDSQNEMKALQWAYQTLVNPESRGNYDKQLAESEVRQGGVVDVGVTRYPPSGLSSSLWSGRGFTAIVIIIALLMAMFFYLDYKQENRKIDADVIPAIGAVYNQEKAIDSYSDIARQDQERRRAELENRARLEAEALDLRRRQQDAQIEMQNKQLEMQQQRQEAMLRVQRQQMEQQRIQREQRYYSCYNAAWDRNKGDGAKAEAYCASYK